MKTQPDKKKSKEGRPTDYKKEYVEQVFKLCLLGATDKEMASFFNVSKATINNWKRNFPEFLDSIKKGRDEADANISAALYSRAKGFVKKDCEKVFQFKGEVVRAKIAEYFPPDTTAAIFWLKNRQPKLWRDKQVQEHTGKDGKDLFQNVHIEVIDKRSNVDENPNNESI